MSRNSKKKRAGKSKTQLGLTTVRSAISKGTRLFPSRIDMRTRWPMRFADLLRAYHGDLGGRDGLSEAQKALTRRAAMLQLQCEMIELRWAESDGEASPRSLAEYGRTVNSLRRCVESLDLHHGPKVIDVTAKAIAMLDEMQAT